METDIRVEKAKDGPGMWYWAFLVDGGVYADGCEGSKQEADRKARLARQEWEDRSV